MLSSSKTKVLIAEDLRSSRMIIESLLRHWGYEPIPCQDGAEAQAALAAPDGPRIAILDWIMPKMTGPELCTWIADELGVFVYTILLTSKGEQQDLVEGLSAGAHAYITKPARPAELETWLKVAQRMVKYEKELAMSNETLSRYALRMESLAEERARQLLHADRMATLGTMSAGIAHEVNNATTILSGNVQTLEQFWPVVQQAIAAAPATDTTNERLAFVLEEVPRLLRGMGTGVLRISEIVKGLETFARRNTHAHLERCQVNECVQAALDLCGNALQCTAQLTLSLDPGLPETMASPQELEQLFVNLIVNACDAMRPDPPGALSISTRLENDEIVFNISDSGPGIPPESMDRIWDPFYTTKNVGEGTGLGLSISLGIVESHGGRYAVENRGEGGASFTITLPVRQGE